MADKIDWASAPEPVNLPTDDIVTAIPPAAPTPVKTNAFKRKPLPSRANPGVQAAPLSPASQSASYFSANYEANAKAAALAAVANSNDAIAGKSHSDHTPSTSTLHPSSANTTPKASMKSPFQSITGRNFFSTRKVAKAPSFSIQPVSMETLTKTKSEEITALPSVPTPPISAPQQDGEATPRAPGLNMARFQSGLDVYSSALKSDVKELSRMLSTTKLKISKAQTHPKWSTTPLRKRKSSTAGTMSTNMTSENLSELPEHEYQEAAHPISPNLAEPITNQIQTGLPNTQTDDIHKAAPQNATDSATHGQGIGYDYGAHRTTPSQSSDHGSIPIMLAPTPRYTMISPSTALYQQELAELPAMPVEMGVSSPRPEITHSEIPVINESQTIPLQEVPGDPDDAILSWQKTQEPAFNLVIAEPESPVATNKEEAPVQEPTVEHEVRQNRSLSVQSRTSQPVSVLSNVHEPQPQGSDTVSGQPSRPSTAEADGHVKEENLKTSSHDSSLGKAIKSEAKEIGRLFQVGKARLKSSDWAKSAKDETKGLSSGIGSVFKKTDPPWKRKTETDAPPRRKNEGKMIADWKY